MPKYWGKQIFTNGRFPEVGQKQKTERERRGGERERLNDGNNNGQATHGARTHAWCTQAAWAKIQRKNLKQLNLLNQVWQRAKLAYEIKSNIFGPGSLRAPCVAWPLLLPSFGLFPSFFSLRLLLLNHFGETPVHWFFSFFCYFLQPAFGHGAGTSP